MTTWMGPPCRGNRRRPLLPGQQLVSTCESTRPSCSDVIRLAADIESYFNGHDRLSTKTPLLVPGLTIRHPRTDS